MSNPTGDGDETDFYRADEACRFVLRWGTHTEDLDHGTITCTARSYTWVNPGNETSSAEGWGQITYSWYWEGPPSTPAGGTLCWENDGDGGASVSGGVVLGQDGSGLSNSAACGFTLVWGDSSSLSMTGGGASGYVEDDDMAFVEADGFGYPEDPHTVDPTEDSDYGEYYASVTWNGFYETEDAIPAGTGMFYVVTEAYCDCESISIASGSTEVGTDTQVNAGLAAYVEFTPNQ